MSTYLSSKDLAGELYFRPNFFQTRARINYLVDHYLNLENLRDRLEDLPKQWQKPTPRIWQKIDWQKINYKQIIGLDISVFLAIISGTVDGALHRRITASISRNFIR